MAGFMAIFGHVMLASMIISPGVSAGMNAQKMRESIEAAKKHQEELEGKWSQIFTAQGKLDQKLKSDIVELFNKINSSIEEANSQHLEFQQQNKTIQYIGISMVMFTFFLLLMKHYDLFDMITEIIVSPFTNKK